MKRQSLQPNSLSQDYTNPDDQLPQTCQEITARNVHCRPIKVVSALFTQIFAHFKVRELKEDAKTKRRKKEFAKINDAKINDCAI